MCFTLLKYVTYKNVLQTGKAWVVNEFGIHTLLLLTPVNFYNSPTDDANIILDAFGFVLFPFIPRFISA